MRGCALVYVGVAGVSGFSNNYEFSEYLLETNVFMQWPLIRILFEFFMHDVENLKFKYLVSWMILENFSCILFSLSLKRMGETNFQAKRGV